jgi:hypothetical protein
MWMIEKPSYGSRNDVSYAYAWAIVHTNVKAVRPVVGVSVNIINQFVQEQLNRMERTIKARKRER